MSTRTHSFPMVLVFVAGIIGGGLGSLLLGTPGLVLADEKAPAVTAQAVHLTDAEGKIRAVIGLDDEGNPQVSVLDDGGQVTRRQGLMVPKMEVITTTPGGLALPRGLVAPEEQCLVLNPQVGFAATP